MPGRQRGKAVKQQAFGIPSCYAGQTIFIALETRFYIETGMKPMDHAMIMSGSSSTDAGQGLLYMRWSRDCRCPHGRTPGGVDRNPHGRNQHGIMMDLAMSLDAYRAGMICASPCPPIFGWPAAASGSAIYCTSKSACPGGAEGSATVDRSAPYMTSSIRYGENDRGTDGRFPPSCRRNVAIPRTSSRCFPPTAIVLSAALTESPA